MNLVTGATGILGSHVVLALLLESKEVLAVKRSGSDTSRVRELFAYYSPDYLPLFEKIRWVELDLPNPLALEEALKEVSVVYHCAGMVSFHRSDRRKLFQFNERVTAGIVDACLHKNIILCHVSSIGTINNSDLSVLTEEVFWKKSGGESDYALSKYNGERQVWRGIEEGLKAVIVNPGVIVSPVFWDQSSGRIFRRCAKGSMFYTGGSSAYISAQDAAAAMVTLVNERKFGGRYILAEGNYTFREIFGRIQANFGIRKPRVHVPKRVLGFLAFLSAVFSVFTKKRPVLTKSLVKAAYNRQEYANFKVLSAINIKFEPIPAVLDKICAYYKTVSDKPKPSV